MVDHRARKVRGAWRRSCAAASMTIISIMVLVPWAQAAPADLIPYGSSGYLYAVYPIDQTPPDWADPGFDESALSSGTAPFGTGSAPGCPLQSGVQTYWPAFSELLLRRTFELPAGATNVQVRVAVDNDVRIAVNGTQLRDDWLFHEGCPNRDDFIEDVPNSFLGPGTNLLAVLGRARHTESYLDVRVTADVPANSPPVATDDSATAVNGIPVTVNVLFNDSDPNGDAITVTNVTQGTNGTVTNNGDGTVTYDPVCFQGMDSFTYTIDDGVGGTDVGMVTVRVRKTSRRGSTPCQ